jgi:tetratricopeptide (TPR) repeat protein
LPIHEIAMIDATSNVPLGDSAAGKPHSNWRLLAALIGAAVLAAGIGFGWWLWLRTPVPDPPVADLAGAEPVVVEAIEAARAAVTRNLRSAAAWGHLGMVLQAHDYLPEAERCFAQAEKLDAADPRWPYLQARTLLKDPSGPSAGVRCLERAVERCGDVPAPRLRLGETLLEQGRLDEAEAHFRWVLERDPKNPRALLGLGQVAHFRGDLKASLNHLTASALIAPKVMATHALLAEIHLRLGNKRAAEEERRRLSQSTDDPGWPDPYFEEVQRYTVGVVPEINKANGLFQQGRGAEAVKMMQQTVARHPDSLLAYLALGRFANQLGDAAQAERALREAVRRKPDAFEAHFELGLALQLQNRTQLAVESYRQTLVLKPDYAPAHYQLGHCLLRQGNRLGALEELRAAVRYRPNFAGCHRDLGYLLVENGAAREALIHLQQAVRLNPADAQAKKLLERLLRQIVVPYGT